MNDHSIDPIDDAIARFKYEIAISEAKSAKVCIKCKTLLPSQELAILDGVEVMQYMCEFCFSQVG